MNTIFDDKLISQLHEIRTWKQIHFILKRFSGSENVVPFYKKKQFSSKRNPMCICFWSFLCFFLAYTTYQDLAKGSYGEAYGSKAHGKIQQIIHLTIQHKADLHNNWNMTVQCPVWSYPLYLTFSITNLNVCCKLEKCCCC